MANRVVPTLVHFQVILMPSPGGSGENPQCDGNGCSFKVTGIRTNPDEVG